MTSPGEQIIARLSTKDAQLLLYAVTAPATLLYVPTIRLLAAIAIRGAQAAQADAGAEATVIR
jgi:hypothetical protein